MSDFVIDLAIGIAGYFATRYIIDWIKRRGQR